jgi:hypothetical protein
MTSPDAPPRNAPIPAAAPLLQAKKHAFENAQPKPK